VSRPERRRFNSRERAALYLAADGRCEITGVELTDSFHADHVVPYSKGGPTDITNGAALSPSANHQKGAKLKLPPLLPWQSDALAIWQEHSATVLVHAHTAAGKTRFAAAVIESELASDPNTFFVVVVPRTTLRSQWADRIHEYTRLNFDPTFENSEPDPRPDVRGIVVNYQGVDSLPERHRRICSKRRTVVIFDEAHRCGEAEHLSWGRSVSFGFEPAARRLLLTGTPVRSDGQPISFLTYEGEPPVARADYVYPYWKGLRDGIVRPVEFRLFGANARWMNAGEMVEQGLSEVDEADEGVALQSAIAQDSEWVATTLSEAAATLDQIRRFIPDAAGLIIGKDQKGHVQHLAAHMSRITGQRVPCAVSDDRGAHATIERFAKSTEPWIAAVSMITEGVDIPRIMVIVYATWVRKEPTFRQAIGRAIRIRRPPLDRYNSHAAIVFLPAVPTFIRLARELEEERDMALRERGDTHEPGDPPEQREAFAADSGWYQDSVLGGITFESAETDRAAKLAEQHHVIGSPAQIAQLLRAATQEGAPIGDDVPTHSEQPEWRRHEQLKKDVNSLLRRRVFDLMGEHPERADFTAMYNEMFRDSGCGVYSTNDASIEVLEKWLAWLAA
jgi:superfamily II DNA or RNA helicase